MTEKPTEPKAPEHTDAEIIAALQKELDKTREDVDKARKDLELFKKRSKAQKHEKQEPASETSTTPEHEHTEPPSISTEPHDLNEGHEKTTGHLMHKWQHYCTGPNCIGENPDFKDETQCNPDEGGCGMHLGSVEVAQSLARCPSCGGTKVRRINK